MSEYSLPNQHLSMENFPKNHLQQMIIERNQQKKTKSGERQLHCEIPQLTENQDVEQ